MNANEPLSVEALRDDVSASAAEFAKALTDLSGAITADISKIIRWSVLNVFRNIIKRSPVDTGVYRGSHGISNLEPLPNEGIAVSIKGQTNVSPSRADQSWFWKVGSGDIWLYNNVPYAEPLENGWSKQAPRGVYRLALREFALFLQEKTANAKGFEPIGGE